MWNCKASLSTVHSTQRSSEMSSTLVLPVCCYTINLALTGITMTSSVCVMSTSCRPRWARFLSGMYAVSQFSVSRHWTDCYLRMCLSL